MNDIIFSEGKNDVFLIGSIVEEIHDSPILKFHAEEEDYERFQQQESQCIRKFVPNPNYDTLAKSEGGKDPLKNAFTHFLDFVVSEDLKAHLLFDLDEESGELSAFLNDLSDRVRQRYQGSGVTLGDATLQKETATFIQASVDVNKRESEIGSFNVYALRPSLEEITDVSDGYNDTEEKIIEFVQDRTQLVGALSDAIS
ncbi:MAG: hypothetical protein ABEI86_08270 [Halobacteriaceae archaeon]